jgi:uncharacterized membrane-anchored protein
MPLYRLDRSSEMPGCNGTAHNRRSDDQLLYENLGLGSVAGIDHHDDFRMHDSRQ